MQHRRSAALGPRYGSSRMYTGFACLHTQHCVPCSRNTHLRISASLATAHVAAATASSTPQVPGAFIQAQLSDSGNDLQQHVTQQHSSSSSDSSKQPWYARQQQQQLQMQPEVTQTVQPAALQPHNLVQMQQHLLQRQQQRHRPWQGHALQYAPAATAAALLLATAYAWQKQQRQQGLQEQTQQQPEQAEQRQLINQQTGVDQGWLQAQQQQLFLQQQQAWHLLQQVVGLLRLAQSTAVSAASAACEAGVAAVTKTAQPVATAIGQLSKSNQNQQQQQQQGKQPQQQWRKQRQEQQGQQQQQQQQPGWWMSLDKVYYLNFGSRAGLLPRIDLNHSLCSESITESLAGAAAVDKQYLVAFESQADAEYVSNILQTGFVAAAVSNGKSPEQAKRTFRGTIVPAKPWFLEDMATVQQIGFEVLPQGRLRHDLNLPGPELEDCIVQQLTGKVPFGQQPQQKQQRQATGRELQPQQLEFSQQQLEQRLVEVQDSQQQQQHHQEEVAAAAIKSSKPSAGRSTDGGFTPVCTDIPLLDFDAERTVMSIPGQSALTALQDLMAAGAAAIPVLLPADGSSSTVSSSGNDGPVISSTVDEAAPGAAEAFADDVDGAIFQQDAQAVPADKSARPLKPKTPAITVSDSQIAAAKTAAAVVNHVDGAAAAVAEPATAIAAGVALSSAADADGSTTTHSSRTAAVLGPASAVSADKLQQQEADTGTITASAADALQQQETNTVQNWEDAAADDADLLMSEYYSIKQQQLGLSEQQLQAAYAKLAGEDASASDNGKVDMPSPITLAAAAAAQGVGLDEPAVADAVAAKFFSSNRKSSSRSNGSVGIGTAAAMGTDIGKGNRVSSSTSSSNKGSAACGSGAPAGAADVLREMQQQLRQLQQQAAVVLQQQQQEQPGQPDEQLQGLLQGINQLQQQMQQAAVSTGAALGADGNNRQLLEGLSAAAAAPTGQPVSRADPVLQAASSRGSSINSMASAADSSPAAPVVEPDAVLSCSSGAGGSDSGSSSKASSSSSGSFPYAVGRVSRQHTSNNSSNAQNGNSIASQPAVPVEGSAATAAFETASATVSGSTEANSSSSGRGASSGRRSWGAWGTNRRIKQASITLFDDTNRPEASMPAPSQHPTATNCSPSSTNASSSAQEYQNPEAPAAARANMGGAGQEIGEPGITDDGTKIVSRKLGVKRPQKIEVDPLQRQTLVKDALRVAAEQMGAGGSQNADDGGFGVHKSSSNSSLGSTPGKQQWWQEKFQAVFLPSIRHADGSVGFVQMDVSLNPNAKDVRVLTFEDRHDCMKCLTVMRQWPAMASAQLSMGAMPSAVVEHEIRDSYQRQLEAVEGGSAALTASMPSGIVVFRRGKLPLRVGMDESEFTQLVMYQAAAQLALSNMGYKFDDA